MYSYKTKKLPHEEVEITVDIPKGDISVEYDHAFDELQKELAVEGFRKGKVPKAIAQKHLRKDLVYQELIRHLLPRIYDEIIKKEVLKPVVSPKVELVKAKEGEDWQIKITIAQRPTVELGDYKSLIKDIKAKEKKADIWVPGKGTPSAEDKKKDEAEVKQKLLNDILTALLKSVKVDLSDLLLEDELNRRLTQLVDDIQKIGLTVDAYLKSKGLTMDEMKARYRKEIEDTYKLEFILNAVADQEKITVDKGELDKLFANIPNPQEKKAAQENSYFYASVLRKQKTLDYLLGL